MELTTSQSTTSASATGRPHVVEEPSVFQKEQQSAALGKTYAAGWTPVGSEASAASSVD
jgi:hypothetical protein